MAHDFRIRECALDVTVGEARDAMEVEVRERCTKGVALAEDVRQLKPAWKPSRQSFSNNR
jgi:hypothetical protein